MSQLLHLMLTSNIATVRAAISAWESAIVDRDAGARATLERGGWEVVDAADGAVMMQDGRPVHRVGGVAMAMRPDVFARHRQDMLDAASRRHEKVVVRGQEEQPKPGEALASVLCPSCQAVMAKAPVCPKCAKGQAGFKILCACTECAHEVYL